MKEFIINIYEQVGGNAAISVDDGNKVYNLISKSINENLKVILDFNNINLMTSPFLNAAIGQLYGVYDDGKIKNNLSIVNLSDIHIDTFKRVVDRARDYFKNKESKENLDDIAKEMIDDE
jgi:hypothetical protein